MSGRVRVTLADGRRVIGFRKTLQQRAPRTPAHLLPDWCASFELPGMFGMGLTLNSIIGVRVAPTGHVEITGKNKQWVLGQTVELLRQIAPYGLPSPLGVRLQRAAEQGPTLSGPMRPAEDHSCQIIFDGHSARLIAGRSIRQIA